MTQESRIPRLELRSERDLSDSATTEHQVALCLASKLRKREREPDDWHVLKTI
jgi:hypothetical protein